MRSPGARTARETERRPCPTVARRTNVVLEYEGLVKRFGATTALAGASFTCSAGSITALIVVGACAGGARGRVGSALVGSACVAAVDAGALRFDAQVQATHIHFFSRLGWERVRPLGGEPVAHGAHVLADRPLRDARRIDEDGTRTAAEGSSAPHRRLVR